MKFIAYCFFTFLLAGFGSCQKAHAQAGLNFTTYIGTGATPNYTSLAYPTAISSGTISQINYNWGSGVVLNSGRADQVMVHVTGFIVAPGTGNQNITFYDSSDDGFRLKINNTVVINNWQEQGPSNFNGSGTITLAGGQVYPIDVWYYENGGGAAMQLDWSYGGIQVVPANAFLQTAPVMYASAITAAEQNRVNLAESRLQAITKNGIYIDQVGSNNNINVSQVGGYNQVDGIGSTSAPVQGSLNTITIRQGDPANPVGKNLIDLSVQGTGSNTINLNQGRDTAGNSTGTDAGNHYQAVSVSGYSNQVTTNQQNTGGTVGHYLEANIVGNYNTVGIVQTDGTTQKQTFASVTGNNNVLNASQTGLGNHFLDVSLTGNGNSAMVTQYGNTANAATINITNAGGPGSVNLTQTGGQVYNISTVCVQAGGCAPITVRQGN
jgi:hypothetical protein